MLGLWQIWGVSQGPLGKWQRKWLHEPCAGVGKLPKPLVELLGAGAFDFPVVRVKENWVELGVGSAAVGERLSRRLKGAKGGTAVCDMRAWSLHAKTKKCPRF